ncbi:MAG: VOC family protein [Chloroflexota bacterium]|nr:VOC family protein [Chloroflexota bacterium]
MASIHPDTQIGLVALTVANLERSVAFYQDVLGFKVIERSNTNAILGTEEGTPLLMLTEQAGARPKPASTTGLYHFAILVPSRADLGRSLLRLAETRYPLGGYADHLVSEALYLSDPDGNGIEIYRDRPRSEWRWRNGQVAMASDPIDIEGMLEEAENDNRPWEGLQPGTRIGHMHLQVGDIRKAEEFYHDILGFDIVAQMPGALFVSAGGYHHHVGLNTWQSRGGSQPTADMAGLRVFSIAVPNEEELTRLSTRLEAASIPFEKQEHAITVRDPWNNVVVLTTDAALPV